jgi:cell division protein FtsQ
MSSRWRLVRARADAVPASVRRFSQRAHRRRLRAALPWLVGLGAVALLAGAGAIVWYTPLVGVAEIRVGGTHLVTPDQVRAAAAVRPGTPLVRVDPAEVGSRVGRLVPVARATVTREWPRALRIRVVERTPVAAVPLAGGRVSIVDRSGVVFDSAARVPTGLPVVRLARPGAGDPTTKAALSVLAALNPRLREPLAQLVADAPARIRLELRDGRQIIWGDASQNQAKVRVATIMLDRNDKIMDVSAPGVVTTR